MEDKDNFQLLYNVCTKALSKAANHLNALTSLLAQDADMVHNLPTDKPALYLEAYDQAYSRLSNVTELIRKFNMQVQLSDLVTTTDLYSSRDLRDHQNELGSITRNMGIVQEPEFHVTSPIHGNYTIGDEGEAIVSHIKCIDKQLFYIVNTSTFACDLLVKLNNFLSTPNKPMTSLPNTGVVFGLFIDDTVQRVVIENNVNKNALSFRVYLLDFGEIVELTNDLNRMFDLPTELQAIAPQAVLCKLNRLHSGISGEPMRLLLEKTIKFKVVRIEPEGALVVDVVYKPNITRTESQIKTKQSQTSVYNNPFAVTQAGSTANAMPKELPHNNLSMVKPQTCNSTNPFAMDLLRLNIEQAEDSVIDPHPNSTDISAEQRRELYEDIGCTDNAMVAVMGYNPQDDRRICQFYDPKTGGCFKGSNCRLEHVAKLKDGWTRDQTPFKMYTRVEMPQATVGSDITVIPTHVIGTNQFYVQLAVNVAKLKEINLKINSTENVIAHKPLRHVPCPLELVLANYTDGHIYRAQVREITEDQQILVYYVDYGDIRAVHLSDLRAWDARTDFLPFQAYPACLDNVNGDNDNPQTADRFRELVLNRELRAHVHFNREELFLTLCDENGFDVGETLCSMGLAELIPDTQRSSQHVVRQ